MLEELLEKANNGNYDFIRFRPVYEGWPGIEDGTLCDFGTESMLKEGGYDKEDLRREVYPYLFATPQVTLGPIVAAWRSMYKRSFLLDNHLYFSEEVRYSEDTIFSARVVRKTNRAYYMEQGKFYHYFYNNQSITKSFKSDRWESAKILMDCFEHYFRDDKEYDFSDELVLQKIYGVLNSLNERHVMKHVWKKYCYCRKIINDSVTKDAFKRLDLVEVPNKLRIILKLIKYRVTIAFLLI